MLKKICFTFLLLLSLSKFAQAQFELKVNLLGVLTEFPAIYGEYLVSRDFSVEVGAGWGGYFQFQENGEDFDHTAADFIISGKYFFRPKNGNDRVFAGIYFRPQSSIKIERNFFFTPGAPVGSAIDNPYRQTTFSAGFLLGRKTVSSDGIIFSYSVGIGRTYIKKKANLFPNTRGENSFLDLGDVGNIIVNLSIGYRFQK